MLTVVAVAGGGPHRRRYLRRVQFGNSYLGCQCPNISPVRSFKYSDAMSANRQLFCPLLFVQQLKGKILVKGKKLSRQEDPTNGNNNLEAEDVSDEDEAAEIEDESVKTEVQQKGKVSKKK